MRALVVLYAIQDRARFGSDGPFRSYARRVRCAHEAAGKQLGSGGHTIGNAHLRWAFAEAACLFLRSRERATKGNDQQVKKRSAGRVRALLAARRARAVSPRWRKGQAFDAARCWQGQAAGTPAATVCGGRTGSSSLCRCAEGVLPLLDLRQARADLRLADVRELLGGTARARLGAQVRGPCPVPASPSPRSRRFSAHLGTNCWPCFRCGAAGKALDLCVQATQQQLSPAVLDWYRRLGRPVPWLPTARRRRISDRPMIPQRLREGQEDHE